MNEVVEPMSVDMTHSTDSHGRGFEDVEATIADSPLLSFGTDFDEPSPALEVPCKVEAGQCPEVKVVDRFTRGVDIVGRFALEPSLLGLKVDPGEAPVRVRVQFGVDETTDEWWDRRTPQDTVRKDTATARLFLLRSQARTRAAVALAAPDMTPDGPARAQVEFDLEPGAVSADGLLILEVVQPPELPQWAADRVMPYAPVGVRVDRIWLDPVDSDDPAAVRPFIANDRDLSAHQVLTLHPAADGAAGRIRVRRHYFRPLAITSRAGRKAWRESRARLLRRPDPAPPMESVVAGWLAADELEIIGVELESGTRVEVEAAAVPSGRNPEHGFVEFCVPDPPAGPVLVGIRHRDRDVANRPELRHRLVTWEVTEDWR